MSTETSFDGRCLTCGKVIQSSAGCTCEAKDYPLAFSGDGLVLRLRMCAADECHYDAWLMGVMKQAADELARLTAENAELRKEVERLKNRQKWVDEPLKEGETAEHIKSCYHRMLLDHAEDETSIEKLVRPFLTEREFSGDKFGVPSPVDLVASLAARATRAEAALARVTQERDKMLEELKQIVESSTACGCAQICHCNDNVTALLAWKESVVESALAVFDALNAKG